MKTIATVCFVALLISPVLAAADAPRGSASGLVVAKGLSWVEVSENGATPVRYYAPEQKTAADTRMLHSVRRAPVGGVVVLVWRREGATLRVEKVETILPSPPPPPSRTVPAALPPRAWFPTITPAARRPIAAQPLALEPQRFGQPFQGQSGRVIGRVMEKGADWIRVCGMDIVFSESTLFRAADVVLDGRAVPDPCILDALSQIEPGRQVVLYWTYDNGLRVVRLSTLRNYDPYSPAELNHSWPGPKR